MKYTLLAGGLLRGLEAHTRRAQGGGTTKEHSSHLISDFSHLHPLHRGMIQCDLSYQISLESVS